MSRENVMNHSELSGNFTSQWALEQTVKGLRPFHTTHKRKRDHEAKREQ